MVTIKPTRTHPGQRLARLLPVCPVSQMYFFNKCQAFVLLMRCLCDVCIRCLIIDVYIICGRLLFITYRRVYFLLCLVCAVWVWYSFGIVCTGSSIQHALWFIGYRWWVVMWFGITVCCCSLLIGA